MFTFTRVCRWEGINQLGQSVSGVELGEQLERVREELHRQGVIVTTLKKTWRIKFANTRLTMKEVADFSRQLAYLLRSGFPLLSALEALSTQYFSNVLMQSLLGSLKANLENGMAFSVALRQYPQYFNKLYIHLIEVGEKCGNLTDQLLQLAKHQEKLLSIRRSIYKSLYYPISLLGIAISVMVLLVVLVIPQFENLFASVGVELPYLTQMLIAFAHGFKSYGLFILLSIVATSILIINFHSKLQRWKIDLKGLILKVPWVGSIIQEAVLARFARTLSAALKAGLSMLEALTIAREVLEYSFYTSALLKAQHAIMTGMPLDQALANTQSFSPLLIQTIEIGQLSGQLEENLEQFATFLEVRVNESVFTMIRFLEPMLLLVLGVLIGLFMFALYRPIFELGNVVGMV